MLLTFALVIVFVLTGCQSKNLRTRLLDFSKNHDEIRLSDITDFDWDIAYIDRDYYYSGEKLKEKYHIEGDFDLLDSDFNYRIAFCKDNILVYDLVLNNFDIEIDKSIEIIYPESIFAIKQISIIPNQKEKKPFLFLKE